MTLLAAGLGDIFGQITPAQGMVGVADAGLGGLFATGIRLFLIMASLVALMFLLWGAIDWITSGGDKDKVAKAREKITQAIVGLFVIIVVLAVFQLIVGHIFGIFDTSGNKWEFNLPTLQ